MTTETDPQGAPAMGLAPSLPPADKLIGRTIDNRYAVEKVLGEGGMGLVYRARHTTLNKPLALKVLRPDVSKDDEVIRRFRQEAQAATAIGNQHIIDIIDFGTLPDASTYFVMEFLDGKDLTHVIEEETPLEQGRVIRIAKQLCRALGAAHEAGIVHRDLKPDNIFLVRRGEEADFVKVLDFGIAKVGSTTKKLTKAGQVFGTPHYMAPEQCAGTGADNRTDIYALGVIIYEMATGQVPFNAESLMGILTKHMYEAPMPPSALDLKAPVDPELEAIILKCLAKDPDTRYQHMGELLADLNRLAAGEAPEAVLRGGADFEPFPMSGTYRTKGRKQWVKWLALGLVALALVVALVAFKGSREQPVVAADQPAPTAPVPAAAPAPAEPTPSPEPPVRTTRIDSVPSNAEVYLLSGGNSAGSIVGNTPFDAPIPSDRSRQRYEIRSVGFQTAEVTVDRNSQPTFTLKLRAERTRSRHAEPSSSGAAATAKPAPASKPATKRRTDDLADPWATP